VIVPAIVAGAPHVHHHERGVLDAIMPFERGAKFLAGENGLFTLDLLVHRERGLGSLRRQFNSSDAIGSEVEGDRRSSIRFVVHQYSSGTAFQDGY
jgi:hypothetical protein